MFQIISNSDFHFSSISDSFTCGFYVATDYGDFPDVEWIDFAKDLFVDWSEAILRVVSLKKAKVELCFYDGPFSVEGTKNGEDVYLEFISQRRLREIQIKQHVSIYDILDALLKGSIHLKKNLYAKGYCTCSNDLDKVIAELKMVIKTLKQQNAGNI